MKRILKYIILLTMAVIMSSGCGDIKKLQEIKIESCRLASIAPKGFASADAELVLVVDNPGKELGISALECIIYRVGEQFCTLSADDFFVMAKQKADCTLPIHLALSPGVNLMTFLSLLKGSVDDYTVDVNAIVKIKGGARLKVTEKAIPLSDLSQMLKNYSNI